MADSDSTPAPLPPSSPAPLLFSPSDQTAAAIIDDFAGQDHTLRGIADKYSTTLEALTLWLARPDIAQRLHALESACAARARLVVANNLAAIANTLLELLVEAKLDHESIHRVPATTHHAFAARMQSRESARKTANLLLRIARYTPLPTHPTPPTHPDAPPPRASSPRVRDVGGEDRLATGQANGQATCQAPEGNQAHLSAHAVQSTAAAPTASPSRHRGITNAHVAPPALEYHSPQPPLPPPHYVEGALAQSHLPRQSPMTGRDAHTPPVNQNEILSIHPTRLTSPTIPSNPANLSSPSHSIHPATSIHLTHARGFSAPIASHTSTPRGRPP